MALENFPLGPEMFDQAFGKTWGPRLWRATFVAVLVVIFGGVVYGAWTVAKRLYADLSGLSLHLPGGPLLWVSGGILALVGLAFFIGLMLTRGNKNRVIRRDMWLQDAVCFVMYGHWPAETEQVFNQEGDVDRAIAVGVKMRELAGEGGLFIWGKSHENRLFELVPIAFWMENQIDGLRLIGNKPENVPTENAVNFRQGAEVYKELMVNKAQVEAVVDQLKP